MSHWSPYDSTSRPVERRPAQLTIACRDTQVDVEGRTLDPDGPYIHRKGSYEYYGDIQVRLPKDANEIACSAVFVVPNPSPANAAYSLDSLVGWYRRLGELRNELSGP